MQQIEEQLRFHREFRFGPGRLRSINPIRPQLEHSCFFQSKTDFVYDKHIHAAYELILSASRPYACFLNGEHLRMDAGQLLLIQPGDTHQGILEHGQELFVATFGMEFDDPQDKNAVLFRNGAPLAQRLLNPANVPHATELMRMFQTLSRSDSARSGYVLNGLFSALFWTLLPGWPEMILNPMFLKETVQEKFRDNLLEQFRKRVHRGACVEELASAMGMTPRSLERKCHEVLQMPPKAAFLNFQFHHLEKWVARSELSIKEISDRYGFENQFHFSRLFKQQFGVSPTQYRKQKR